MQKYAFLSDEWVGEAKRIYAEAGVGGAIAGATTLAPVRVNLIVTDAPFSIGSGRCPRGHVCGALRYRCGPLGRAGCHHLARL